MGGRAGGDRPELVEVLDAIRGVLDAPDAAGKSGARSSRSRACANDEGDGRDSGQEGLGRAEPRQPVHEDLLDGWTMGLCPKAQRDTDDAPRWLALMVPFTSVWLLELEGHP